jgi:hypothetical protein
MTDILIAATFDIVAELLLRWAFTRPKPKGPKT